VINFLKEQTMKYAAWEVSKYGLLAIVAAGALGLLAGGMFVRHIGRMP
jgi:hypothetical protein